ncbi:MAG: YcxB family protein [Nannocystaceae bacterium]|nr:YcxB family protein [Nannocystaceae bacterium]
MVRHNASVVEADWEDGPADRSRAVEHAKSHRWALGFLLVVAAVTGLLSRTVPTGSVLASMLVMTLYAGLIVWIGLRRSHDALEDWRPGIWELRLSEERFTIYDERAGISMDWDLIVAWEETAEDFYVYYDLENAFVLPKRVFASTDKLTLARQLFTDRISAIGRKRVIRHRQRWWFPAILGRTSLFTLMIGALVEAAAR